VPLPLPLPRVCAEPLAATAALAAAATINVFIIEIPFKPLKERPGRSDEWPFMKGGGTPPHRRDEAFGSCDEDVRSDVLAGTDRAAPH